MKAGRPGLALTSSLGLYIGNTSDEALVVGPMELFGFSTGGFEECYCPRLGPYVLALSEDM